MKASRARLQHGINFPLPTAWASRLGLPLPTENSAISVNAIDAGIRTLAVITVLALSLLGYGRTGEPHLGPSLDPSLVAAALVVYNLIVVGLLGVPWRKPPGFYLFLIDWLVVSVALVLTGGFFSPFLILYYALIIGAALRVGLSKSLLLVGACAVVYGALSLVQPTPVEAIHLPLLVVGATSLLMVAVTAVAMKRALEVEVHRVVREEQTAEQLRLLNNLTRVVLSGSLDIERVMRTVAVVSSEALQADSGLAVLNEPVRTHVMQTGGYASGRLIVADMDPNPPRLSADEVRLADEAAHTLAPVTREGTFPHNAFPGLERGGLQVKSVACAPFLLSGGAIGVLFVARHDDRPFTETEVSLLTAIAQQMAVAVRLARLYSMEQERAARSEEAEKLERDLLSMVSHELRTPLTSIKTCVGALTSMEAPSPDSNEPDSMESKLIHNIGRSTDRLIVLVNELLDMARLRAGRVSLNRQRLNMGEVAHEMALQVKPLLDARDQSLVLDLPAPKSARWHMLDVMADRRRIEQAILNLLSNANKYAPNGSKIALGVTPRDGEVRIFVRDDGPGIAISEQGRIFEKFYRAATPGGSRPEGSGLGLAIARSIVELHKGHIGVQSRPGRGSMFFFALPAATGAAEHPRVPAGTMENLV
jgi:K+-sensing histidine kinase KdpD